MNNYTSNNQVQDTVTPIACCQAGECRTTAKHPHTYRAPVDVYETEDRFIVIADMPGTTPEDIELNVDGSTLEMTGTVTDRYGELGSVSRQEYGLGDYHRHFRVGTGIATEQITATYSDGILTVNLPKQPVVEPRRIEITEN